MVVKFPHKTHQIWLLQVYIDEGCHSIEKEEIPGFQVVKFLVSAYETHIEAQILGFRFSFNLFRVRCLTFSFLQISCSVLRALIVLYLRVAARLTKSSSGLIYEASRFACPWLNGRYLK